MTTVHLARYLRKDKTPEGRVLLSLLLSQPPLTPREFSDAYQIANQYVKRKLYMAAYNNTEDK